MRPTGIADAEDLLELECQMRPDFSGVWEPADPQPAPPARDQLTLVSDVSLDGKPVGEMTQVYRLDGGDLVVEATRRVPAGTFNETHTYRRRTGRQ